MVVNVLYIMRLCRIWESTGWGGKAWASVLCVALYWESSGGGILEEQEYQGDRREMEAFGGRRTNTAVASILPVMSLQTWKCRLHSQNISASVIWKIGDLIAELENWGEITLMWNILFQNNKLLELFELCCFFRFSGFLSKTSKVVLNTK